MTDNASVPVPSWYEPTAQVAAGLVFAGETAQALYESLGGVREPLGDVNFGIECAHLSESFFVQTWDDVINGRRTVEDGLGEALARIGTTVAVPLDRVIYSADVGCQKHDPRFFEIASDRLGLDADERTSVLFVDDVMHNVEVARSFGWRAVHASADQPWGHEVTELLGLPR